METFLYSSIVIIIPFLGTVLGAITVFFLKNKLNDKVEKFLLGFAAGVMVAASIWSLILPSIDMSAHLEKLAILPAAIGFLLGILFLLLMDTWIPHLHLNANKPEGRNTKKINTTSLLMVLAVTLHNIPEGMSVGVILAGAISQNTNITILGALSLAIGIALQNFPEGAIVSLPLKSQGISKPKAFGLGVLSGVVEPISALITLLLVHIVEPVLPYLLSFAAGAMIYVVIEELIPESQSEEHSNIATISFAIGFVLMMVLDFTLA